MNKRFESNFNYSNYSNYSNFNNWSYLCSKTN